MTAGEHNEVLRLGPCSSRHPRHATNHALTRSSTEAEATVVANVDREAVIAIGVQRRPEGQPNERVVGHAGTGEVAARGRKKRNVVREVHVVHACKVPRVTALDGGVVGAAFFVGRDHHGQRHAGRWGLRCVGSMQAHPIELHVDCGVATRKGDAAEQFEANNVPTPNSGRPGRFVVTAIGEIEMHVLKARSSQQVKADQTLLAGSVPPSNRKAHIGFGANAHGHLCVAATIDWALPSVVPPRQHRAGLRPVHEQAQLGIVSGGCGEYTAREINSIGVCDTSADDGDDVFGVREVPRIAERVGGEVARCRQVGRRRKRPGEIYLGTRRNGVGRLRGERQERRCENEYEYRPAKKHHLIYRRVTRPS
ncbi:unannotated protein [freshwater metagenome]|uniref:Unannotated protein n=1 Tax=freshwater metagenome TaxID=449393 RepID=A0A6J6PIP5_9ZZZZ